MAGRAEADLWRDAALEVPEWLGRIHLRIVSSARTPEDRLLCFFDAVPELFVDPEFLGTEGVAETISGRGGSSGASYAARRDRTRLHTYLSALAHGAGCADPEHIAEQWMTLFDFAYVGAYLGVSDPVRLSRRVAGDLLAGVLGPTRPGAATTPRRRADPLLSNAASTEDQQRWPEALRHAARVLLVGDDRTDVALIRAALSQGRNGESVDLSWTRTFEEASKVLDQSAFDCVLLDLEGRAKQAGGQLRELNERHPNLPVVVLAGRHQERLGREMVAQGAMAQVPKSQIDGRLARIVQNAASRSWFADTPASFSSHQSQTHPPQPPYLGAGLPPIDALDEREARKLLDATAALRSSAETAVGAQVCLAVTDADGRVVMANDAMCRLLGADPQSVLAGAAALGANLALPAASTDLPALLAQS